MTARVAKNRCDAIIAREPEVISQRGEQRTDWTHLQFCGRPVKKNHKCARHQPPFVDKLGNRWRRWVRSWSR
jgi:hypothetical protein